MTPIAREFADFRADFEQVLDAWNALSAEARRGAWSHYLDAIDRGDAGWTKFHLVLDSPFTYGLDPTDGLRMGEFGIVPARAEAPA